MSNMPFAVKVLIYSAQTVKNKAGLPFDDAHRNKENMELILIERMKLVKTKVIFRIISFVNGMGLTTDLFLAWLY
jgi:hypothetical protein